MNITFKSIISRTFNYNPIKTHKKPEIAGQDFFEESQLFFTFSRFKLQMFERFTASIINLCNCYYR